MPAPPASDAGAAGAAGTAGKAGKAGESGESGEAADAADAASAVTAVSPAIVVLGDSHTYGAFGERLHEHLAALGRYAVISEGAGGATSETYLEDRPEALVGYRVRESAPGERAPRLRVDRLRGPIDRLDDLLARYDPEVVVVALGTNRPRAPVGESCDALVARIVRSVRSVDGRPKRRLVWIGPPAVGKDRGAPTVASLRACVEKVGGAVFVDSTVFNAAHPLPRENPHFGPDEAARWADAAFARAAPAIPP